MRKATILAAAIFGVAGQASAATEIQWWHAMGGANGERVDKIATDFNASQDQCKVTPSFKGDYSQTMTGAIAAFRAGQQPDIVQVFEVGTATMMAAEGAIYPVHQLMADTKEPFDPEGFIAPVKGYYTTADGQMLSMPFNSSTPVLWYNKTAFEKAGLDPSKPPATWPELEADAKKLQEAGYACGFTTAWPSWIQIENLSAWHDQPVGTLENGFGGLDTEFVFNKGVALEHIKKMAEWQKSKVFDYGGRTNKAAPKFYNQDCAMYTESSAGLGGIRENAKDFEFGTGRLPYWPDVKGAPQNTIIGGASLWVLKGHTDEQYACTAKFFSYLSSPEVQAWWHQETGYLPITKAAYELSKKQGFYDKNPEAEVALKEMLNKEPTANSKGIRFGNMVQVRDVIEEELERVWAGDATAQEALDAAVSRGDDLLRQFERQNQ
ncbi:MAG: sn-glycerol-3-phosphate ABC transporter substrate-binding protein UgpB [Geminicoccaceae bacterium]|nr:sn-glycerol-3-phosphate ABC transporter substrate-binding protein UgpB [Geminicoccaceae bacterium]